MADLFDYEPPARIYWDRKSYTSLEEHVGALRGSKTVYVGNLSFYTTEAQIYELFSKVGDVARVIMGLDRHKSTPCGFCFVEYFSGGDATASINFVHGTTLDERVIKVELDPGFRQGRQYGRGNAGGQPREQIADLFDYEPPARIDWDHMSHTSLEEYVVALRGSKTVRVGNLSFDMEEAQVYKLFSKVGGVPRVIMGCGHRKPAPCGFCCVK
ncbi:unnamed protein product [Phaeothamnion confervicola]